jgi:hypothetical protein
VNSDQIAVGPKPPSDINAIIKVPLCSDLIQCEFDE